MFSSKVYFPIGAAFKVSRRFAGSKGKLNEKFIKKEPSKIYEKLSRYKHVHYRSRNAFNLIELDANFGLFSPGAVVVDCGAAPGSWSQVALERTNADASDKGKPVGKVFAVDLEYITRLPGLTVIPATDMRRKECHDKVVSALDGARADVVLSDMCEHPTGITDHDHEVSVELVRVLMAFAVRVLKEDGHLVAQFLPGGRQSVVLANVRKHFETAKVATTDFATKNNNKLYYIVARKFRKPERKEQDGNATGVS